MSGWAVGVKRGGRRFWTEEARCILSIFLEIERSFLMGFAFWSVSE